MGNTFTAGKFAPPQRSSSRGWKRNSVGGCELDLRGTGQGLGLGPSEHGNELVVPTEASDFMTGERMLGPQQGLFSMAFVTEKLPEVSVKNLIKV
jgi:hypothetical protein